MERRSPAAVAATTSIALCLLGACTVGNHDLGSPAPQDEHDVGAPSAPAELGEPTAATATQPHWEAVVLGGDATLFTDPLPGESGNTAPLLRIEDVSEPLTVFSDRPERFSGELAVHELVTLWAGGAFGGDPPNAAVVNGGEVATLELTGAVWDPATSTAWFSTRALGESLGGWDPGSGPTQVFIDAFARPSSQVTDAVTQSNVKVIGQAPAMAMGLTYQAMAGSISLDTDDAQQEAHSLDQPAGALDQLGGAATEAGIREILAGSGG